MSDDRTNKQQEIGAIKRIADLLFGYDYFLAHRSIDGKPFALALHTALSQKGVELECFLDAKNYEAGRRLSWMQSRALKTTIRLVVIVTPGAHNGESSYLLSEVREFRKLHPDGIVVPIGTISTLTESFYRESTLLPLLPHLPDDICILESEEALLSGKPSAATISKLLNDFTEERSATRRLRWVRGTAAVLAILLSLSITLGVAAWQQSLKAKKELKNTQRLAAESSLKNGETAIRYDRDPGAALLWFAQALLAVEDSSPAARLSARTLIGGWASTVPVPSIDTGRTIFNLSYSPDGKTLAGTAGKEVTLWNRTSLKPVGDPLFHDQTVMAIQYSPDGRILATICRNNHVNLWATSTGKRVGEPLDHGAIVTCIAFSPDGNVLATGSQDNSLKLWDVKTQAQIGEPFQNDSPVNSIAFSPDGKILAVGLQDNYQESTRKSCIRLWNQETRKFQEIKDRDTVLGVSFSPDGKTLATACFDGNARLWDLSRNAQKGSDMPTAKSTGGIYSPDGSFFATDGRGNEAALWRIQESSIRQSKLPHEGEVSSLAFAPRGKLLATGSSDKKVRLWECDFGRSFGPPFYHSFPVTSVAFSPEGTDLASASQEGIRLRAIDETMGWASRIQRTRHKNKVVAATFSQDGERLVTAHRNQAIVSWDFATSGESEKLPPPPEKNWIDSAFSQDGRTLAATSNDHRFSLWDVDTERLIASSTTPPGNSTRLLAISSRRRQSTNLPPNGEPLPANTFVVVATGKRIGIWRPQGTSLTETQHFDQATNVTRGQLSHDGSLLVIACQDRTVRISNLLSNTSVDLPATGGFVYTADFSPDNRLIALGIDKELRLSDARTGRPCGQILRHPSALSIVAFSPDGTLIATGCGDNKVRLWDANTGQLAAEPWVCGKRPELIAFSANGRKLAVAGDESTVVRVANVPQPAPDHPQRIWRSVQMRTHLTLENGMLRPLSPEELGALAKEFEEMPDPLAEPAADTESLGKSAADLLTAPSRRD